MKNSFEKVIARMGEASIPVLNSGIDKNEIREIRINSGQKIEIITGKGRFSVGEKALTKQEIGDIFASLCEYSVHTYKNEICEGFVTAEGGCRIGICGTAIYEGEKIIGIKDICGLNIRIPHEIFGAAKDIAEFAKEGLLIIGPPCSGKTTVLRDLARLLGESYKISMVDERFEIAGSYRGEPSFNVGGAFVLSGFNKSDGIKSAVRALAPNIIICDEFGDKEDISSAMYAMKSGVTMVASMHALDKEDLLTKPFIDEILKAKIFKYFAFLNRDCKVYEIIKAKEMVL